jgi:hypothetical protein
MSRIGLFSNFGKISDISLCTIPFGFMIEPNK